MIMVGLLFEKFRIIHKKENTKQIIEIEVIIDEYRE